jgi:hypothetical protein
MSTLSNPKRLAIPKHLQFISNLPPACSDPVRYFLKTALDDPISWHADLQFLFGYESIWVHKGDFTSAILHAGYNLYSVFLSTHVF